MTYAEVYFVKLLTIKKQFLQNWPNFFQRKRHLLLLFIRGTLKILTIIIIFFVAFPNNIFCFCNFLLAFTLNITFYYYFPFAIHTQLGVVVLCHFFFSIKKASAQKYIFGFFFQTKIIYDLPSADKLPNNS